MSRGVIFSVFCRKKRKQPDNYQNAGLLWKLVIYESPTLRFVRDFELFAKRLFFVANVTL